MSISKIKLLNIGEIDGIIRLQSQLSIGKRSVDFILEDGVLKVWRMGDKGFNFYKTNIPYEIVENEANLKIQIL